MVPMRFVNVAYKYHSADERGEIIEGHTTPQRILQYWNSNKQKYEDVPYIENIILKR